ncbi:MAG: hypothetical protein OEY23_03735 [Acidimicrobiia bacterium]|nr:hypothetical protein [Acidimicrobiia bacterium]
MGWFVAQSLLSIAGAFAVGLVTGYLLCIRRLRRVELNESGLVARLDADHRIQLRDRDRALDELRDQNRRLLANRPPTAPASGEAAAPPSTADPVELVRAAFRAEVGTGAGAPQRSASGSPSPSDGAAETDTATLRRQLALLMAERDSLARQLAAGGATSSGSAAADAASPPAPDVLERIEGVGPRFADALRRAGLQRFVDVAEASETQLRTALADGGLGHAPSLPTWSQQARYLAAGDLDSLAVYQRHLTSSPLTLGFGQPAARRAESTPPTDGGAGSHEEALRRAGVERFGDLAAASEGGAAQTEATTGPAR